MNAGRSVSVKSLNRRLGARIELSGSYIGNLYNIVEIGETMPRRRILPIG
jgi:hypothetical protein